MIRASFLGFGWLRPHWFWLALAGLVVLLVGLAWTRARSRALAGLVSERQRRRFAPDLSLGRARLRWMLASLALVSLAAAAAGPVRGHTLREVRRRGLDIVVCVDTSRSMLVRDLRPDRLSRARREVRGLIERMRGDRMALIAFAGDAREVAPLTHDKTALAALLDGMTPAENEKGGTDLGAALQRALAGFDGRTGAHECIVILTDGEDLEGRGLEIAQGAGTRGVKVFVVGMGTEAGGKIPLEKPGGGEAFLRDKDGHEVVSTMRGRGLEELASATGGAYLSADSSAAPLEELYEKRISRLESRELAGGQEFVPHDRFQWFLALATVAAVLAAGLRERRGVALSGKLSGVLPFRRAASGDGRSAKLGGAGARPAARQVERPSWARAFAPWILFATPQVELPSTPPPAPESAAAAVTGPASRAGAPQGTSLGSAGLPPVAPSGGPARSGASRPDVDGRLGGASPQLDPAAPAKPAVEPYSGSLRQGLIELRRALDEKRLDEAETLSARLAALPSLDAKERALVAYHQGALEEHVGRAREAAQAFSGAGGLAEPGALRLDAWYNAGTALLGGAESAYLEIPEVREARKLPPLDPAAGAAGQPPQPGAAAPSGGEDPNADIARAEELYREARQSLVFRLRADWKDADTRANLELIQRRLRELDELRRRREQQKQEQQQQDQQQQDQQKDQQKDPQKQDPQGQDPQQPRDPSKDPSDPQAKEPPQQDPNQPQDANQRKDAQETKPEDGKQQPPPPQAGEQAGEPRELSKEEVQRLLDRLADIERQDKELQARIRAIRRQPVEKDW